MLKTLKFSGLEYNFFFVSDLHEHHGKDFIYGKRKNPVTNKVYSSVEEHDQGIIDGWNSVCTKDSIVFNLGDVCFGDPDGNNFKNLMRRLNFSKQYILWGNHTSGHRQVYIETLMAHFPNAVQATDKGTEISHEVYPLAYNVDGDPNKQVIFLPTYAEIQINSTKLVLSHFPIRSWNNMGHGSFMVHGHQHYTDTASHANTLNNGKVLDVSIEGLCEYNESKPINLIHLKKIFSRKDIKQIDHH